MAQDVAPSLERLIDHFLPVEPSKIEAEFDRIWQDASSGSLDSSSVRLRVSNFIAWGAESETGERFERVMETLALRHPCRGILAVTSGEATVVESAISAHCWRTATGGRHICSEEILLRGHPGSENQLASAVLALLVPELPVHLWLVGEPEFARRVPDELLHVVDRIYVDSAYSASTQLGLRTILTATADQEPTILDLAWQRGSVWRDLVAQMFDSPIVIGELERVTSISVDGGAEHVSTGALLIAGWLVARLNLNAASIDAGETLVDATCYDGSRGVTLRVTPSPAGLEIGRVSLSTPDAEFLVELHAESGHMHVRSNFTAEPVHRTVSRAPDDDASVLTDALDDTTGLAVYMDALHAAVVLAEG